MDHQKSSHWLAGEETNGNQYIEEEEKSWRDPSAAKLRASLKNWININAARKEIIEVTSTTVSPDIKLKYFAEAEIK